MNTPMINMISNIDVTFSVNVLELALLCNTVVAKRIFHVIQEQTLVNKPLVPVVLMVLTTCIIKKL